MAIQDMLPSREHVAEAVLQALPCPVVLLSRDLGVTLCNTKAEGLFCEAAAPGRRLGDLLGCRNAASLEEGCGHSEACPACPLRQAGGEALAGNTVVQREVRLTVWRGDRQNLVALLVSAAPVDGGDSAAAVVLIQDVTVLHRLRGLIPICMHCKRIRNRNQAWGELERFIEDHSLAQFSHGLCPECLRRHYPEASDCRDS